MKYTVILFSIFTFFAGVAILLPQTGQAAIDTFNEVRKFGNEAQNGIISNAPCTGVSSSGGDKPTFSLTCQLCHLVNLIDKFIRWLTLFAFGVATFLFIYGGYHIMFFAASEHLYTEGVNIIRGTVVGLVIVLTSWLLINTLFVVMKYKPSGSLPWNQVECAGNPLSNIGTQEASKPTLTGGQTPLSTLPTASTQSNRITIAGFDIDLDSAPSPTLVNIEGFFAPDRVNNAIENGLTQFNQLTPDQRQQAVDNFNELPPADQARVSDYLGGFSDNLRKKVYDTLSTQTLSNNENTLFKRLLKQ